MSTWIFLRGLTRESGHWGAFTPQFEAALPGCDVVALDLPGNGSLCHQASPTRVQDMVAHCRAELDRRWLPPPYHLLGMSLGAMVAVAWSAAHPMEVAAQVLINTSLRPFSPFYQRLRPHHYGLLLRLVLRGASPEDWERSILRITSHGGQDAVLPQWLALRAQHPVSRANALRQLLAAARYRAPDAVSTPHLAAGQRTRPVGFGRLLAGPGPAVAMRPAGASHRRTRPATGRRRLGGPADRRGVSTI